MEQTVSYNPELLPDLHLTHSILNYLLACYQGKFAWLNILNRLNYEKIGPQDLKAAERSFDTISKWVNALWRGEPLLYRSWSEPDSFDADKAMNLLTELVGELNRVAQMVRNVLTNRDEALMERPEDVKILIAAIGRYAYSQDNYIKGFIKFGETFGLPEIVSQYTPYLGPMQEKVKLSHTFLKIFAQEQPQTDFYQSLRSVCVPLPGKFKMYVHDIVQLSSVYKGEFTFEMAGIDKAEAQRWMAAGLGPQFAGYWRAYDISPENASLWTQFGLSDPESVASWVAYGFSPESCTRWYALNFPPALARRWSDAGYDPDSAANLINQGYEFPENV